MAEYIERNAAVKAAEHAWGEWNLAMATADGPREINLVYKMQELCDGVASVFRAAPAADVEPVRHGWWKFSGDEYGDYAKCSACGDEIQCYEADSAATTYCPNCGAKMDMAENQ